MVLETHAEPLAFISVAIPLQIDDIRAAELSSNQSNTPSEEHTPRQLIIEELGDTGLKAQILDYRVGTYCAQPACLFLMRFVFFGVSARQRVRRATIEVVFDDAPLSLSEIPNPLLRPRLRQPCDPGPIYLGKEENVQMSKSLSVAATIGMPLSGAGLGFNAQQSVTYSVQSHAKISSECKGKPAAYAITWALEQNLSTKRGVATEFTVPLVVEYIELRRFCARVKVSAEIGHRLKRKNLKLPTWGESDDPVYFDPQQMEVREGPLMIAGKPVNVTGDFTEDLRGLTRIIFPGEEGYPFRIV